MPEIILRPYQEEVLDTIRRAKDKSAVFVQLPTGSGKSILQALVAKDATDKGQRVTYVTPYDHLVDNALKNLHLFYKPEEIGIVKAKRNETDRPVTICSVQTLTRDGRLDGLAGTFDKVIVDEGHLFLSEAFNAAVSQLPSPNGQTLGWSATIKRLDGKPLSDLFGELIYTKPLWQMIQEGWLCNLKGIQLNAEIDWGQLNRRQGDYQDDELAALLSTEDAMENIFQGWEQYAKDRITMGFFPSVQVAHDYAEYWRTRGYTAAAVDGSMPEKEQDRIISDFMEGRVQVLQNCMLLSVGFDHPPIQCILAARPTKSQTLYIQQCLDMETEILAKDGWKKAGEILVGDLVAAMDKEGESLHWVPALDTVYRELDTTEHMVAYAGTSLDIRVTGGHDLLVSQRQGRKHTWSSWKKMTAEDVSTLKDLHRVPIAAIQEAQGVPLSDDELRFVGWFLTDGTLNQKTKGIMISQAKHQPYNVNIRACLEGCGFRYGICEITPKSNFNATSNSLRYSISYGNPRRKADSHLRGWKHLEAYIDKNLSESLEDMTREQLLVLLEAMNLGNGNKHVAKDWTSRSYHITTGNEILVDRLQSLCVRRGLKCNKSDYMSRWGNKVFLMHIKDTTTRTIGSQAGTDRPTWKVEEYKPESVWCVQNALGTLVIRRNGKVAIVGNCGRGTRTCKQKMFDACTAPLKGKILPSKEDCLVLDVAGSTALGLEQFAGLFDLPAPEVARLQQRMAAGDELDAREIADHARPLYQARAIVATRVDLVAESSFVWAKTRFGWVANLGDRMVSIIKSGRRSFVVEVLEHGKKRFIQQEPIELEWAMALAEEWVAQEVTADPMAARLIQRDAEWRNDRLTPRQFITLKMLCRKRFSNWETYEDYLESESPISKGDASELIGAKFAERDRKRGK